MVARFVRGLYLSIPGCLEKLSLITNDSAELLKIANGNPDLWANKLLPDVNIGEYFITSRTKASSRTA